MINANLALNDGREIPQLGLGVWRIPNGRKCEGAVLAAFEAGYRHIDTASFYGTKPFHPTWQPVPTTAARMHVVEIHTDEGITGIGSGGVPVRWEVAGLFLMGQDPFAMEQHVANLRSMAFFVGRPWPVEIALWDIIGKATGQPIYKLLGGGSDKLKAYASTGELRPLEARVEAASRPSPPASRRSNFASTAPTGATTCARSPLSARQSATRST